MTLTRLFLRPSHLLAVLVTATTLCLTMPSAYAQVDAPGSQDHALFERYPLSYIESYSQQVAPQYRLALGAVKKVGGVVAPEQDRYLRDHLVTRITYRVSEERSSDDVMAYVKETLEQRPHEILFECESRGCGSSNDWANVQFGIPQLYGLDREQLYLAVKLAQPADTYLAFYAVKRANRRLYLQVDVLAPQTQSVQSVGELLSRLNKSERVFLPEGASDNAVQALSEALKSLLSDSSYATVWLIGHQGSNQPFATLKNNSVTQAQQLREKLIRLGVPGTKLKAEGVGGFAPTYQSQIPDNRVEVVIE